MTIQQESPARATAGARYPLAPTQQFLCLFDSGDDAGPFGPRYNIVSAVRLRGRIDLDALRLALADLVVRHEALRTTIVRDPTDPHQVVHPPTEPELIVRLLPDAEGVPRRLAAEHFVNAVDADTHGVRSLPHLTAVLGRFDDTDAVLALVVHHTATDGWSQQILVRDLVTAYGARAGAAPVGSPEPRQYREYAEGQQALLAGAAAGAARAYWREKLRGAQLIAVPTDHPRSAGREKVTAINRFVLDPELSIAAQRLARGLRSSPFMVLLAAYAVLLQRVTGTTDAVIPVITSGRRQEEYSDTVGPVFNFVPFRIDLDGAATFRTVLDRTRTTCIEAYLHELPFLQIMAEAPELMAAAVQDTAATVAIQVVQFPTVTAGTMVAGVEFAEIRRRVVSQAVGEDIPDGALLTLDLDPDGDLVGRLGFNTNLYDPETMAALLAEYESVLRAAVADPNGPLSGGGRR
jgi:hypothetical protein